MARNSNKLWTHEDDEKLRALATRNASLMKATAAMRRSQHSVQRRAQELGLTFRTPTQERDRLRAAMSA
jgi:hypothetical protein